MAEDIKKIQPGAYEFTPQELTMEAATFADGSRIVPKITIYTGRKYIPWRDCGETARWFDYPIKLLEMYNNSSLHHSIIDMKSRKIAGGGLEVIDPNSPNAQKTMDFLLTENSDGLDCNELNEMICFDHELFNGFCIQTIFRKDWKKIDQLKHLEFNKIRMQTPDFENQNSYGYWWAMDWTLYRPSRMQYIEKFDMGMAKKKQSEYKEITDRIMDNNYPEDVDQLKNFVAQGNTQLFYYRHYQPNSHYYPLPNYLAIIPSIETDILSDMYATASLNNGMDSGLIITILGDSSDPESQATAKRIMKSYAGARKAGKPVFIFTPSFEEAPKIEPINNTNSLAQKYKIINEATQQKILSGHNLPNSSMVGIATSGKLGQSNESQSAEEIFFNNYVLPRQVPIEKFWNKIMKYNGLDPVRIINRNIFNESAIDTREAGMPINTIGAAVYTTKQNLPPVTNQTSIETPNLDQNHTQLP